MLVWCSWVPMVVLLIAILLLLPVAALLAWGAARMLQVSEPKLLFGRFLIIKNISKTRSNECCRNSRLLQHLHFGSSFHDQKRTENWTNECGRHSRRPTCACFIALCLRTNKPGVLATSALSRQKQALIAAFLGSAVLASDSQPCARPK